MKRCLLVTSFFPPAFAADMQRARHLARHLPAAGWEATVLCAHESLSPPAAIDPQAARFESGADVRKVRGCLEGLFTAIGTRSLEWRVWWPFFKEGLSLLKGVDLVYITNARFGLFTLGSAWKNRTGVPYVLDFHDPWVVKRLYRTFRPSWRSRLSGAFDPACERASVKGCGGVISVSADYIAELTARHPFLSSRPTEEIPFGAEEDDIRVGRALAQSEAASDGRFFRVVYVGAGGSIMARAFDAACAGLKKLLDAGHPAARRVRIELRGTSPAAAPKTGTSLSDVARRHALQDFVREEGDTVPYSRALAMAAGADALLLLGVDAPGYIPSKLYTYALFEKPLFAAFREGSPAARHYFGVPALGEGVTFDAEGRFDAEASAGAWEALLSGKVRPRVARVGEHLAARMAERHAAFFNRVLEARR